MPRSKTYNNDLVLEKAMNIFWLNGYEATSVRMLEKEMGINQFSIYASFKNKKNLFIQSIRSYREFVKKYRFQVLLQHDAGLAELQDFLMKSVTASQDGLSAKGCLIVNTAGELGSKDKDIEEEINGYYDFVREMLENVIRNAIKKNEIAPDSNVKQQANFFLGVMQGISVASKTMNSSQLNDFVSVALAQVK